MKKPIYMLNEAGQALLKTLVDQQTDDYIDAVIALEYQMEDGDMPHFERTVFGTEHFDLIKEFK